MYVFSTINYHGGEMFIVASKVVAFQRYKNVGDHTQYGPATRPQTKVWISMEHETEEWIVLDSVEDFRKKFLDCLDEQKIGGKE